MVMRDSVGRTAMICFPVPASLFVPIALPLGSSRSANISADYSEVPHPVFLPDRMLVELFVTVEEDYRVGMPGSEIVISKHRADLADVLFQWSIAQSVKHALQLDNVPRDCIAQNYKVWLART